MPEKFRVGAALCEGENRLYELQINETASFDQFLTWRGGSEPVKMD